MPPSSRMLFPTMRVVLLFLSVLVGVATASDLSDLLQMTMILDKPRVLDRQKPPQTLSLESKFRETTFQKKLQPQLGFSWSDCGSSSSSIKLQSLSVAPDPISLPGKITISGALSLSDEIGNNTKVSASVTLEKKVVVWIKVPCMHHIGSCEYDNVCDLIPFKHSCPPIFKKLNIPCKCPFRKGSYHVPQTSFQVNRSVPSGDYKATVQLKSDGQEIGCISAAFSVGS